MSLKVYIDGKYYDSQEAKVSVFDHGLLYGDGVFEGIRAYNGRVFRLTEHINRLYDSAQAIMLTIPLSKKEMADALLKTLVLNGQKDAYIRLIVTRGVGDLGLDPNKCPKASIIIITADIKLYPAEFYEKGLSVVTVSVRRNIPEALSPRIKSLNYLNNILAKIEANISGSIEAIMLSQEGYVAECTGDNIFIIKNGALITPPAYIGALDGITKNAVIGIGRGTFRMLIKEEVFTRYELYTADECFLTGTAAEVIPVTKIDNRVIGNGLPGRITLDIIKEFKALIRTEGTPIE